MRVWMLPCWAMLLACSPLDDSRQELIKLGTGELLEGKDFTAASSNYQIGSEWGKKAVEDTDFNELPSLESIAKGTGNVGGGTGFYLGRFGGQHVVATNHHVCPAGFNCLGGNFSLPLLKKKYKLATFLQTWNMIDLTLLTITVPAADEELLASIANPFDFELSLRPGQELMTVGFGVSQNPSRQLTANADADCRVFSRQGDFRLLADPDSVSPSSYKTWSFANGCDVSHGDSGSAFVDRASGRVIGLLWTGKIPKKSEIQDSAYLEQLLQEDDAEIWEQLSYAVPAAKIREQLQADFDSGSLRPTSRAIIADMLGLSESEL